MDAIWPYENRFKLCIQYIYSLSFLVHECLVPETHLSSSCPGSSAPDADLVCGVNHWAIQEIYIYIYYTMYNKIQNIVTVTYQFSINLWYLTLQCCSMFQIRAVKLIIILFVFFSPCTTDPVTFCTFFTVRFPVEILYSTWSVAVQCGKKNGVLVFLCRWLIAVTRMWYLKYCQHLEWQLLGMD